MNARRATTGQLALCGLLGVCLLSGCSAWPWRKVPLDAATGFYKAATLTYRLDAGKLQQPLDVARVEGQRVSYDQVASSPLPDQSIGTLLITYPHPDGRPDMAQARFTLDSIRTKPTTSTSWNPFKKKPIQEPQVLGLTSSQPEIHEVWTLDIQSGESDQLFKLLANQGFYNTQRPQAVGAQLAVKINGTDAHKDWDQVPELNALIQRVRRDGQLVAYVRPTIVTGKQQGTIVSTRAYSDLLAQTATVPGEQVAASSAASPFSMAAPPAIPTAYPATVASRP